MNGHPHLNLLLLSKLPLNIIWRLIGLSRRINIDLHNELLWKEQCQKEFPLLPTMVPSYRYYWFHNSWKVYGTLYIDNEPTTLDRCTRLYLTGEDVFVTTIDDEICRITQDEEGLNVSSYFSSVKQIIYDGSDFYVTVDDRPNKLFSLRHPDVKLALIPELSDLIGMAFIHAYRLCLVSSGMIYLTRENRYNGVDRHKLEVVTALLPHRRFISLTLIEWDYDVARVAVVPTDGPKEEWIIDIEQFMQNDYSILIRPMEENNGGEPSMGRRTILITQFGPGSRITIDHSGEAYLHSRLFETKKTKFAYRRVCDLSIGRRSYIIAGRQF